MEFTSLTLWMYLRENKHTSCPSTPVYNTSHTTFQYVNYLRKLCIKTDLTYTETCTQEHSCSHTPVRFSSHSFNEECGLSVILHTRATYYKQRKSNQEVKLFIFYFSDKIFVNKIIALHRVSFVICWQRELVNQQAFLLSPHIHVFSYSCVSVMAGILYSRQDS